MILLNISTFRSRIKYLTCVWVFKVKTGLTGKTKEIAKLKFFFLRLIMFLFKLICTDIPQKCSHKGLMYQQVVVFLANVKQLPVCSLIHTTSKLRFHIYGFKSFWGILKTLMHLHTLSIKLFEFNVCIFLWLVLLKLLNCYYFVLVKVVFFNHQ